MKSLALHVTGRCNLNCSFCYAKGLWQDDMSLKTIDGLCDYAIKNKVEEVVWIGGEAVLHPSWAQIALLCKELLISGVKTVRVNTNAMNIHPILTHLPPSHVSFINVSFYHFPTSDMGKKQWDGAKTLKALGYSLRVNFVVCRSNLSYLKEMIKIAYEELAPLEINVHNISTAGNERRYHSEEVDPLTYSRFWKEIEKEPYYDRLSGPCVYLPKKGVKQKDLACIAVRPLRLYVLPDGRAFSCPYIILDASQYIRTKYTWDGKDFIENQEHDEHYKSGRGCIYHKDFTSYKTPEGFVALCRFIKNRKSNYSVC